MVREGAVNGSYCYFHLQGSGHWMEGKDSFVLLLCGVHCHCSLGINTDHLRKWVEALCKGQEGSGQGKSQPLWCVAVSWSASYEPQWTQRCLSLNAEALRGGREWGENSSVGGTPCRNAAEGSQSRPEPQLLFVQRSQLRCSLGGLPCQWSWEPFWLLLEGKNSISLILIFFFNFGWQEWAEMEQVRETLQSSNLQIYEFKAATMPDSLYIYLTLFYFRFYLFCSSKVTWFLWEGFRFKEKDWFYADTILFSLLPLERNSFLLCSRWGCMKLEA